MLQQDQSADVVDGVSTVCLPRAALHCAVDCSIGSLPEHGHSAVAGRLLWYSGNVPLPGVAPAEIVLPAGLQRV